MDNNYVAGERRLNARIAASVSELKSLEQGVEVCRVV